MRMALADPAGRTDPLDILDEEKANVLRNYHNLIKDEVGRADELLVKPCYRVPEYCGLSS